MLCYLIYKWQIVWFMCTNLTFLSANVLLKFVYNVYEHNTQINSIFGLTSFYGSKLNALFILAEKRGIHVLWTHTPFFV